MTDRTVLVTGGTGKLGRSFVLGFAGLGDNVIFVGRNKEVAEALQREAAAAGATGCTWINVDLAADGAASRVTEQLRSEGRAPTALVNSARNVEYLKPVSTGRIRSADWLGEFTLGVVLSYELTMDLATETNSRLTTVINIGSMYGVTAPNLRLYDQPDQQSPVNYGVVKAALIQLTKELAVRLAPKVCVNAVSFGGVDGRVDQSFRERYAKLCPSGKMLNDSEVFGAVKFLASADAAGMTGHNLVVDGGWTLW